MAFTIGPFIVASKHEKQNKILMNHEKIHTVQWKECFYIGFLIMFLANSLWLLIKHRSFEKAYKLNIFEKEAYKYQSELDYLDRRVKYAWRYL